MAKKKRAKLGRPPKHPGERLIKNRTFRTRGSLDDQLQTAAEKAGHSVSEEIERRLEDSFRTEGIYGGPEISAMFRTLASHIALAKAKTGGHWAENDQARDNIAKVFADLLAKELPRFYSVTIETVGNHGEIRGVTGYASEEIAEKEIPGIAEILRARREAVASRSTNTQSEDSK